MVQTQNLAESLKARTEDLKKVAREAFRDMVVPFLKYPDDLAVDVYEDAGDIVIEPQANFADMGRILGKERQTHAALATLLALVGEKHRASFKLLKLLPAVKGHREENSNPKADPNWKAEDMAAQIASILSRMLHQPVKIEFRNKGLQTRFKIAFSPAEKISVAPASIAFALSRVFHATGKHIGRDIYIEEKRT